MAAVILAVMPHTMVGVFYDDGIYLALAKSLATGHGYHLQYLPGAPGAVHYPFGYPLFLAALWKLWPSFPANVVLFRGANAVLMGLAAAFLVAHLAPRLEQPRWLTALVVVAAATAVPMVAVATVLFSEPLFIVLAALACWAADATSKRDGVGALKLALLAGLLAGLSALTRSIGVAVIGGVVLGLGFAQRRREAVVAAVAAALPLVPWLIWSGAHHASVDPLMASNYGTYGDFLRQGGSNWLSLESFGEVARPLAAISLPPVATAARVILGLLALAVLLTGFGTLTRRAPAAGWMLWCYVVIVALWPYAPDRFVWGALPWLAVAFAAGVLRVATLETRAVRPFAWIAAAAVAVGFGRLQVQGYRIHGETSEQTGISATFDEIVPWIRSATDSNAVVAGEDEALLWLYTGRRAVPSYLWRVHGRDAESFGPDSLHAFLERSGATHLILTGPGSDAAPTIDALISRKPGYLQLIRVWPGQLMAFRIQRGA